MRILIYGSGAIGSAFGGFLSNAGHQVTLHGRPWHLNQIKKHGLKIDGIWGRHIFKDFQLVTRFHQLKRLRQSFDLILLSVKSYDTDRACRELKLLRIRCPILLLQNGLGNIEVAHQYFTKSQVLAGRVIFGSELVPGRVKITVWGGDVLIGETSKKTISPRAKQIANLFTRAGIKSQPVRNIQKHIWAKVIYNSSLNPLASLLNTHYGTLLESGCTRQIMREVVRECYAVAKKIGQDLNPPTSERYIHWLFTKLIPDTYHHHPSMLSDLKRGKRTEIDALNGAIAKIGKANGIKTPVNSLLAQVIKKR